MRLQTAYTGYAWTQFSPLYRLQFDEERKFSKLHSEMTALQVP